MSWTAPARLKALVRQRCDIWQTVYNPTSQHTGAKYLRSRLRGPSMLTYYPQRIDIAKIVREYPILNIRNEDEEQRLQDIEDRKRRGKSAPKKAKTKADSRRASRRR